MAQSTFQNVLDTIVDLVNDRAWTVVSPADVAVLTLAAVLHDSAMHLGEDGLAALIDDERRPIIEQFNDKPWAALWDEWLTTSRRLDDATIVRLFGAHETYAHELSGLRSSRFPVLIAGEFIRQNHPRLAHEIALFGVPGPHPAKLSLIGLPFDLLDLAGLVARSHGIPLRTTLTYLSRYHIRDYNGVHAVWLMSLLRIADYLQIQSSRAPAQLRLTFRMKSPFSKREWDVHSCVKNITRAIDDPEAVLVQAMPQSVDTYYRLREWLEGLQRELDVAWAVLGELYGRFPGLSSLGLSLRRILSNTDDLSSFEKTVSYIPRRALISADRAEFIKLLVNPLYGNRPEVGIRELLQNALDAVRELVWSKYSSRFSSMGLRPDSASA
jgi:hypothetical protein